MGSPGAVTFTSWHWLGLGALLLLLEVLTPGFVFIWLAVAAGLIGILLWLLPLLAWQVQLLAFAALAVLCVGAWFGWRRRMSAGQDAAGLNNRMQNYVGTEAMLVEPIGPGHGRVRIGDSTWLAAGPDLPAGSRVRIVGARGALLLVAQADPGPIGPERRSGSPSSAERPI